MVTLNKGLPSSQLVRVVKNHSRVSWIICRPTRVEALIEALRYVR